MSDNKVGGIYIELGANTAKFESDMGKAGRLAELEMKRAERAAMAMGVAVGAAAAAAVGSLAYLAQQSIDAADQLDELKQKVGGTVEQLSTFNFIARMNGADTGMMADAWKKLNLTVADAANGQATAQQAFADLGIEIRDANGAVKDGSTLMLEISDRFASMEDGALKTDAAVSLFGRSGADMIPMLNIGSRAMEEMAQKAKRLGVVVSEDTAAAAAQFNDNLDEMQLSLAGLGNQVAASALPGLNKLAGALNDDNSLLRDSIRLAGTAAVAYAAVTVAMNAKAIALAAAAAAQRAFNVAAAANPYALAAAGVGMLVAAVYNYNRAMPEVVKVTEEASTAMTRFDAITRRAKEAIEAQNRAAAGMTLGQIKTKVQDVTGSIDMLEKKLKRAQDAFARGAVSSGLVASYEQQLKLKQDQLEKLTALIGEQEKKAAAPKVAGAAPKKAGGAGQDNFDYGGLNFGALDGLAADEAASAADYLARERQKVEASVQGIQQGLLSKRMIEAQDYQAKQQQLQQAAQLDIINETQKNALLEDLERQHKGRIRAMDEEELERKRQANQQVVGFFSNGLAAIANSNSKYAKDAQRLQKAQQLVKIAVDTRAAAMGAYAALAGIPIVGPALGIAAAGAAIAFGAAQASAIGGSVGGTSTPSAPVTPSAAGSVEPAYGRDDRTRNQTTILQIPSNRMMTGRDLADWINEALGDGYTMTNLRVMAV